MINGIPLGMIYVLTLHVVHNILVPCSTIIVYYYFYVTHTGQLVLGSFSYCKCTFGICTSRGQKVRPRNYCTARKF